MLLFHWLPTNWTVSIISYMSHRQSRKAGEVWSCWVSGLHETNQTMSQFLDHQADDVLR
jgi:hypothetical protein